MFVVVGGKIDVCQFVVVGGEIDVCQFVVKLMFVSLLL